ncbi:MAG: hypothetical protein ACYC4Q_06920 [Victivallaceae bacterium]
MKMKEIKSWRFHWITSLKASQSCIIILFFAVIIGAAIFFAFNTIWHIIPLFLFIALILAYRYNRFFKLELQKFKCPNCGRKIDKHYLGQGDLVHFICKECDIDWNTRVYGGSDTTFPPP